MQLISNKSEHIYFVVLQTLLS